MQITKYFCVKKKCFGAALYIACEFLHASDLFCVHVYMLQHACEEAAHDPGSSSEAL